MANTLNGSEIKIWLIFLIVAGNLSTADPWGPFLLDGPVEVLNPMSRSQHWDGTISISREEKHLEIFMMSHDAVNPEGAFILFMPLAINCIIALDPGCVLILEKVILNTKLGLDIWGVQIVRYFSSTNL